jgi:hypothetical protein
MYQFSKVDFCKQPRSYISNTCCYNVLCARLVSQICILFTILQGHLILPLTHAHTPFFVYSLLLALPGVYDVIPGSFVMVNA